MWPVSKSLRATLVILALKYYSDVTDSYPSVPIETDRQRPIIIQPFPGCWSDSGKWIRQVCYTNSMCSRPRQRKKVNSWSYCKIFDTTFLTQCSVCLSVGLYRSIVILVTYSLLYLLGVDKMKFLYMYKNNVARHSRYGCIGQSIAPCN